MGMIMSYMGGSGEGIASQTLDLVSGALYDQFMKKEVKDFETFHTAILDIFNTINMALPGKHYDVPSHKEIEVFFENWNYTSGKTVKTSEQLEDEKKNIFIEFMIKNVNISKVDDSMMVTGIVAPPAAMVAKRTGQSVPQLSVMKAIPDVIFVPTATILALIAVKVTKRMSLKKLNPRTEQDTHTRPKPEQSEPTVGISDRVETDVESEWIPTVGLEPSAQP